MSHFTVLVIGDNIKEQLAPYQENNMGDCPEEYLEFNDKEQECREEWETGGSKEWYPDLRDRLDTEDIEAELEKIKKAGTYKFKLTDRMDMTKVKEGARVSICGWINGESGTENYRELYGKITSFKTIEGLDVWNKKTSEEKKEFKKWYDDDLEFQDAKLKLKEMEIEVSIIDSPRIIPHKEQFPTFEKYMKEYEGYDGVDEKTGKYGYWENPNAKWDWYEIGGRWTGFFKLKRGTTGVTGKPGLMTSPATPGYVDSVLKKDIAFDAMFDEAYDKAGERWDRVNEVIKHFPKPETWDEVRERIKNIDKARKFYHDQPMVKSFKEWSYKNKEWDELEPYLVDKKEFQTKAGRNVFITFALLKDGKWYQRGEMGWWATVSNEDEDWDEKFFEMLKEVPDDTLLTVVDCHI